MAFVAIAASQVDAESPIDDNLMELIKDNFDDHESRLIANKSFDYQFKLNGPVEYINLRYGKRKLLDGALISGVQTLTFAKLYCGSPGLVGTLSIDLRKYKKTDTLITAIASQYTGSITSINQVNPALATQSITLATPAIATQSISLFKAAVNVSSIILLGSNLVRYNLASAIDTDWEVGDTVTFASCTNAANDGSFLIVRVADDGGNNLVVTNASGVAQTSAAGTATLRAYSYNFTNPVDSNFAAGETCAGTTHTSGSSDGNLLIYATNSGGNNIVVKRPSGVVQAGVAGTVTTWRWVYSYLSAVVSTDFEVGDAAFFSGHTSGLNNGAKLIRAVNSGGNNLIVTSQLGVAQGGVAGTAATVRWTYALTTTPATSFNVGETVLISGAIDSNNNGEFVVKQINRGGTNNLVVYNSNGVTQAGSSGTAAHTYQVVSFASNQGTTYAVGGNVELSENIATSADAGYYDVVEINRGGGSNYNIVIDASGLTAQASPAGRVLNESRSVLSAPLDLEFPASGENTANNSPLRIASASSMSAEAVFSAGDVSAGAVLALDLLEIPTGNIGDIVVQTA